MTTRPRTGRARASRRPGAAPASQLGEEASGPAARAGGGRALALGAAFLALGAAHIAALRFLYDDAFISFRYAENLARGFGLVYNPGERVEGYSNFLWTVLMAIVVLLRGKPEAWCHALSATFALASLGLVLLAAHRRGLSVLLAGMILASNSAWAAWGTGGLETAMFGTWLTAGTLALCFAFESAPADEGATAAASPRLFALSALAFGLGCLTRPDGPLPAACAAGVLVVLGLRRRLRAREAFPWAALLALCVAPHVAWRLAYYGRLLPNTFAVKAPGLLRFDLGGRYLWNAFLDLHLYLILPVALAGLLLRRRAGGLTGLDRAAIAAVVVPFAIYLASTGGDFMPVFRFVAPLLPLIALAAAHGFEALADLASGRPARWVARAAVTAVVLAYAGLNLAGTWHQQAIWNKGELVSVGWARQETDDWLRIGDLLGRVALPTDTLATTAAGAVPYRSRLYTLDMLGLNAPDLSRYRRLPDVRPGHQLLIEERWIAEHPPQILLAHPLVHSTPAHLGFYYDMRDEWRERVLGHYQLIGMTLLGSPVRYVGCAVRNDVADRIVAAGVALQQQGR